MHIIMAVDAQQLKVRPAERDLRIGNIFRRQMLTVMNDLSRRDDAALSAELAQTAAAFAERLAAFLPCGGFINSVKLRFMMPAQI